MTAYGGLEQGVCRLKKKTRHRASLEGTAPRRNGWRPGFWSSLDAQEHPQPGRGAAPAWFHDRSNDGRPVVAQVEILAADESEAFGAHQGPGSGPSVSTHGTSPATLFALRMADYQRGREEKGTGGQFKNSGVRWCDVPDDVLDHDFPNDAIGRAIPYGIYDEARNTGHVVVGTSHETPEFAVKAIRTWWLKCGRRPYPKAPRLRIEADGGGANGSRIWRWKIALQKLADEIRLPIDVSHLPPGASKWNWIEHRMFNLISKNWAGHPLRSYEIMLNHIRSTKSSTGFRCRASLDKCVYRVKIKVSKEDKKLEGLKRDKILPNWNYTVFPCNH